jgi:hypothetical protein
VVLARLLVLAQTQDQDQKQEPHHPLELLQA